MKQTSIKEAKKVIWLRLQAYCSDDELWESEIYDENWSPTAFHKALTSIVNQIERKL
jgi:hypothetical protein